MLPVRIAGSEHHRSERFFLVLCPVSARFEVPPPLTARVFAVHSKRVPNELARAQRRHRDAEGRGRNRDRRTKPWKRRVAERRSGIETREARNEA